MSVKLCHHFLCKFLQQKYYKLLLERNDDYFVCVIMCNCQRCLFVLTGEVPGSGYLSFPGELYKLARKSA